MAVAPESERTKRGSVARVRRLVGQLIWVVCALAALSLAVAALLIAVGANVENQLVGFVMDVADVADVGLFDLSKPIVTFDGENAATSTALLNYGVGALCWLVVGKVLDRIVRPR